jgi:hypothetical protein
MGKKREIVTYLKNCSMFVARGCVAGTGLTAIHKRIFNHMKNVATADIVRELSEFYAYEKNILDIWNALSVCEQDFITYIVQYGGIEYFPTTLEYAKKHNFVVEYKTSYGYTRSIFESYEYAYLKFLHLLHRHIPTTKAVLLFPSGKDMPPFILKTLQTVIKPMEWKYEEYVPLKTDFIICRENRLGDFASLVRFISTEQIKVAVETFDLTKAKIVKLSETIGFEEVCDRNGKFCALREAKRSSNFKVAPLLFALAINSKLVEVDSEGNVLPGKQSADLFIKLPQEFAKRLFDDYAKENGIREFNYVPYIKVYGGEGWVKWDNCRKLVFELLKSCPMGVFVKFKDFNKYANIFLGDIFRQVINCSILIKEANFSYTPWGNYRPDWDECEAQLIRIILSFLSTIGIIDIAYTQNIPRVKYSYDDFYVGIAGFRITKLGAWILGMVDKYDGTAEVITQNAVGELLVLPDYSIVISGLKCRIEHEAFLSQFLTKISSDENAAIYKLDFKSIVRAYGNEITPLKIKKYLKNASNKPLPVNVERILSDWQTKVGRVKIREVTVLETDDALLLEEIKHIKAMKDIIIDELPHAVILTNDNKKKAKTLIEKNGWLVKI